VATPCGRRDSILVAGCISGEYQMMRFVTHVAAALVRTAS